jgi:hypothetical protein
MVRRGSTVRVRQRAYQNYEVAAKRGLLVAAIDIVDHLSDEEGLRDSGRSVCSRPAALRGERPMSPQEAVERWWQAIRTPTSTPSAACTRRLLPWAGPEGGELGRDAFLSGAKRFFAAGRVDGWEPGEQEARRHGDTAICS